MIIGIDGSRAFEERPTGVGLFSRGLIEAFARENSFPKPNAVVLFVRSGQRPHDTELSLPLNWTVAEISAPILWTQVALRRELKRKKIDTFLVPSHALPFRSLCRTVYVFHGSEMAENKSHYPLAGRILNSALIRMSLRQADSVLVVSQTSALGAARYYGAQKKKITVVYQGIDRGNDLLPGHTTASQKEDALREFDIKKPYLLYLGSIEKRKNIRGILAGFEIFSESNKGVMLILAGAAGYGHKEFEQLIGRLGSRSFIKMIGPIGEKEKKLLIENADCLLAPSFSEGFGRTVLEGLSAALPVVAADIPVFRELYGNLPIYANPFNAHDIAVAMAAAREEKQKGFPAWKKTKIDELLNGVYNWRNVAQKAASVVLSQKSFDKI